MQQITYDQIEPGEVAPFYSSPEAPSAHARGLHYNEGAGAASDVTTHATATGRWF